MSHWWVIPMKKARYVYWGAVAYNPDTGQTGKASNELQQRTAENEALVRSNCTYNLIAISMLSGNLWCINKDQIGLFWF